MVGPIDKQTALRAFALLAQRLAAKGEVATVYLFGGGAVVVGFDERVSTSDLDARFTSTSSVMAEVYEVARELGLANYWLNEQGTAYLPREDEEHPEPVYDHPNLRVLRASNRHLLAMKAAAARRLTEDVSDIRLLARHMGLSTVEEIVAVHDAVFPDEPLAAFKLAVIAEALSEEP